MGVLGYLMGVLGYLMGVLGYLMGVPIKYPRTAVKYPKTPEDGGRHIGGVWGGWGTTILVTRIVDQITRIDNPNNPGPGPSLTL